MKAYLLTTGIIFGLITMVHVWRVFVEGTYLMTEPWYGLTTLAAGTMCLWAWRLIRTLARA